MATQPTPSLLATKAPINWAPINAASAPASQATPPAPATNTSATQGEFNAPVQFPAPGSQPATGPVTNTSTTPGEFNGPVQFQLPASAQAAADAVNSSTSSNAFNQNLPLGTKILQGQQVTPQQGKDTIKGAIKGIGQVAEQGDVLNTMNKLAGKPSLGQSLGYDENTVFNASNPTQEAGKIGVEALAQATPAPEVGAEAGVVKGLISDAVKGAEDPVVTAVSPRLTPKVAADTATQTKGLIRNIVPAVTKKTQAVADAVRPYFNPKATWSDNAQSADKAISTLADQTENYIKANDHPVVIKEIASQIKNAPVPISVKATPFEKQIGTLKTAFTNLLQKNGGTVSGTFQSLREFDNLVDRDYPTLWDRENAPMRQAVTSLRNTVKDFVESNLPKNSPYKDLLGQQSNLFDARDTFREKAALGELQQQGEIGTNAFQRFGMRHPTTIGLIKKGVVGAAAAAGAGEVAGHVANSNK